MRYKFRAWNKRDKIMFVNVHNVYDACEWKTSTGECKDLFEGSFGDILDNDDFIVMQYTGMKDVNGKEIYEGDIVKTRTGNLIVEWGDDIACFECVSDCSARGLYGYITDGGVEIIGNIHEKEKPL